MLVHGDDFAAVARAAGRAFVEKTLSAVYEIKVDMAGPQAQDQKEIKILGRIISYEAGGLSYEADPGHMEAVIHELGLSGAKGAATPGVKDDADVSAAELLERRKGYAPPPFHIGPMGEITVPSEPSGALPSALRETESPELTGSQLKLYQSLAARLNYFSLDRLDLLFAVKELMRNTVTFCALPPPLSPVPAGTPLSGT